jgi:hypothetical protein
MPSTPVVDTTSKTITGKMATAKFTWDNLTNVFDLSCILDVMRIREVIPMDNSTVFCTEGSSSNDPGTATLLFEIGGLGKYDGPASGPFIPAPQNVAIVMTFHTGCTLTMNANFTEASLDKVAGQNARIGARGLNAGTYALAWDKVAGP